MPVVIVAYAGRDTRLSSCADLQRLATVINLEAFRISSSCGGCIASCTSSCRASCERAVTKARAQVAGPRECGRSGTHPEVCSARNPELGPARLPHAGWDFVYSSRTPRSPQDQPEVAECFSARCGVDRDVCAHVPQPAVLPRPAHRRSHGASGWRPTKRPTPVWRVADRSRNRLPVRAAWVAEYERAAAGFAACRFTSRSDGQRQPCIPTSTPPSSCTTPRSRATSELPLA